MGADIHVCVDWTESSVGLTGPTSDFVRGHFFDYLDRDYVMFGLLANVRGGDCLFGAEPRGFPSLPNAPLRNGYTRAGYIYASQIPGAPIISDTALSGLASRVVFRDKGESDEDYAKKVSEWRNYSPGFSSPMSEEDAARYIDQYHEVDLADFTITDASGESTRTRWITHPDVHSVSWITLDEFEYAMAYRARLARETGGEEGVAQMRRWMSRWFAVLGYMRGMGPELKPRLVFGFDN